ncbi:MAG: hypothetical protein EAZ85_13475 [Bacteroidetes bacterium]|nr:MAG: hypothetical protein EAZ85_13475 [Bacteroidota bacterium]TAG86426.1 MAG: hypothetical protein EAZ20_12835 [Bacteroidota bacterium]
MKQDLAHYQQQYNEEKLKELALEKAKKEGNKNIDKIKPMLKFCQAKKFTRQKLNKDFLLISQ